jgi:hypothetical protein
MTLASTTTAIFRPRLSNSEPSPWLPDGSTEKPDADLAESAYDRAE